MKHKPAAVAIAPEHLVSLAAICGKFGVGQRTVREWTEAGAPIVFDGRQYSAEYNQLQNWRVEHSRKTLSTPSPTRPGES